MNLVNTIELLLNLELMHLIYILLSWSTLMFGGQLAPLVYVVLVILLLLLMIILAEFGYMCLKIDLNCLMHFNYFMLKFWINLMTNYVLLELIMLLNIRLVHSSTSLSLGYYSPNLFVPLNRMALLKGKMGSSLLLLVLLCFKWLYLNFFRQMQFLQPFIC